MEYGKFPVPQVFGRPIAVYQMGKVGSTSIIRGLNALNLPDSVHHIHLLSHAGIRAGNTKSRQIADSHVLRDYLDSDPQPRLNVITAVREPISQFLSSLFQNLKTRFSQFLNAAGHCDTDQIIEFLSNEFTNSNAAINSAFRWFDDEFQQALGIDVFADPFDTAVGSKTIDKGNTRVLILRLEDNHTWPATITEFLNLRQPIAINRENAADDKPYQAEYQIVKNGLSFPVDVLRRIYANPFSQHFYSETEIENFIAKWERPIASAA